MARAQLGGVLRELRIHLCQTGETSKGVRDFLNKYYVELKSGNQSFPILVRECSGVQPRLWARYVTPCSGHEINFRQDGTDGRNVTCKVPKVYFIECKTKGKESSVSLSNMGSEDVLKQVQTMARQ